MRIVHALVALAVSVLPVVSQAAPDDSRESVESIASSARVCQDNPGASCTSDANCGGHLVCNMYCPVVPGRVHCEIAGGQCGPRCTQTGKSLSGKSFTSRDGAHSISFESPTTYRKTDGCPNTGIHCNHIVLSTGTYRASGETVSLTSNQGANDTLRVEPHCSDGLLDTSDGVELYPAI